MNEGEIRMQAQMYALVAEMQSIIVSVDGMKADNAERESHGLAQAWPGNLFFEASAELKNIAISLREKI